MSSSFATLLAWASLSGSALGQEQPAEQSVTPVDGSPPQAPEVRAYFPHARWKPTGFSWPSVSVAVCPTGEILASDTAGVVRRSSQGLGWGIVLEGEDRSAEDILLDASSSVGDVREVDTDESSDGSGSTVVTDVDTEGALLDTEHGAESDRGAGTGPLRPTTLWASSRAPGLVLAARPDGLWRSEDGGLSWDSVSFFPSAEFFVEDPRSPVGVLSATDLGVFGSDDLGATWFSVAPPPLRGLIRGLDVVGSDMLAGTATGAFRWVEDGWVIVPSVHEGISSVVHDAAGAVFLLGQGRVLRSDDQGQTFTVVASTPVAGHQLVPLREPGHLMLVDVAGVWETTDGGQSWAPASAGVDGAEVEAVVMTDAGPIAATSVGVVLLGPWVDRGGAGQASGPSLHQVVSRSLDRDGIRVHDLGVQHGIIRAAYVPRLQVQGQARHTYDLSTDYDAVSSDGGDALDWAFGASLCFGGCTATATSDSGTSFDGDYYDGDPQDLADDSDATDAGIVVLDGEVYVDDSANYAAAAAHVASEVTTYRTELATLIANLFWARQALLMQQDQPEQGSLVEQVRSRIDLDELTARLDALSEGTFTRSDGT